MAPEIGPVIDPKEYVLRELDKTLLLHLERRDYVSIRGGRQTGKTSAAIQAIRKLRARGVDCVYLDLERLSPNGEAWSRELAEALADELGVSDVISVAEAVRNVDSPARLEGLLAVALAARAEARPVVIFLDEITAIPEETQAHFFAVIRAIHGLRGSGNRLALMSESVTFAMIGTFDPERLVPESLNSPFNVSEEIDTSDYDFTVVQCESLSVGNGLGAEIGAEVYALTGGHPYLTRRIMGLVVSGMDVAHARLQLLSGRDSNIRQLASNLATVGGRALELLNRIVAGETITILPAVNRVYDRLIVLGVLCIDERAVAHIRCQLYADFIREFTRVQSLLAPLPCSEESAPARCDALVFAALPEEFAALQALLVDPAQRTLATGKVVVSGRLVRSAGPDVSVALCYLTGMGNATSGAAAAPVVGELRPKAVFMCGIAGGVKPEDQAFGDILIGTEVWYFGLQRLGEDGAEIRPKVIQVDAALLDRAALLVVDWSSAGLGTIRGGSGPEVFVGPIGCGESVYASDEATRALLKIQPKLIGVEMESFGVALACSQHPDRPRFMPVRAVSDLANAAKDDKAHELAAASAAWWLVSFLRKVTLPD